MSTLTWIRRRALVARILPRSLHTFVRRQRTIRSIAQFEPRRAIHDYCGFRLQVLLADPLGAAWYDRDVSDIPEITALRRHRLRRGARVFDVGAHQCVVALVLAKIVGDNGSVVAVEAVPHNAMVGECNRKLNGTRNIAIINAAVAERSGAVFVSGELNAQVSENGGWGKAPIPAVTIDDLALQFGQPDVVVVDVEGSEARVLKGSIGTMRSARPHFMVEVHVGCGLEAAGGSVEEILSFFGHFGYELRVAPGADEYHAVEFQAIDHAVAVLEERFFLLALPRP